MPVVRWRSAEMFASGDAERSRVDIPGNLAQLRFLADLATHFDGGPIATELAQKGTFKKNDLKERIMAETKSFRQSWK